MLSPPPPYHDVWVDVPPSPLFVLKVSDGGLDIKLKIPKETAKHVYMYVFLNVCRVFDAIW